MSQDESIPLMNLKVTQKFLTLRKLYPGPNCAVTIRIVMLSSIDPARALMCICAMFAQLCHNLRLRVQLIDPYSQVFTGSHQ